jgi:hypothetical protein
MLSGGGKKGDKRVGFRAQVANSAIRRQRADMKKNAGRTLKLHTWIIAASRVLV